MGRSFSRAVPFGEVTDFYHAPSDTHFAMESRGGKYFQRRWQIGFDGRPTNVEEREASFVLGSGNHARTWLARAATGKLIELPLGWYAERGGYFALNPGYDTIRPPAQRPVTYECMFCHNAYPQIPPGHEAPDSEPVYGRDMPAGIDCQRCHGPGAKHVAAARGAVNVSDIRSSIVNPSRLPYERRMEVCLQCHLETASTRLPSLIRRFDRGPFSYIPGQPLGDFVLSFDHPPGTGHEDKFEIAGAGYRLRQSRCFLESKGRLTCTTCHNPHDVPRGEDAERHYTSICRDCHSKQDEVHISAVSCTPCHMPKRRTEDAVHVVMTDHRIVRTLPAGDLLAPLQEKHPLAVDEYRGEVVPYYPEHLGARSDDRLYVGAAQVLQGSNLTAGIRQLTDLLASDRQAPPYFRVVLENARRMAGESAQPETRKAKPFDSDDADSWNTLGAKQGSSGEQSLRRALQLDPYHALAHANLARLLAGSGKLDEAIYHFDKAARLQPLNGINLYEYALTLVQMNRFEESQTQVEAALKADSSIAEAHELLGGLHSRKGEREAALREYEEAVRLKPDFGRAQLDLGLTLAASGDLKRAREHLREAAKSADPRVSGPARQALDQIGR